MLKPGACRADFVTQVALSKALGLPGGTTVALFKDMKTRIQIFLSAQFLCFSALAEGIADSELRGTLDPYGGAPAISRPKLAPGQELVMCMVEGVKFLMEEHAEGFSDEASLRLIEVDAARNICEIETVGLTKEQIRSALKEAHQHLLRIYLPEEFEKQRGQLI